MDHFDTTEIFAGLRIEVSRRWRFLAWPAGTWPPRPSRCTASDFIT